jgi:hypothetical protein
MTLSLSLHIMEEKTDGRKACGRAPPLRKLLFFLSCHYVKKNVAGHRRDFTTPSSFFTFTSTRKSGGGKKTRRGPYTTSAQLVTSKLVSRHHGSIIHIIITDETNAGLSSARAPGEDYDAISSIRVILGIEERKQRVVPGNQI